MSSSCILLEFVYFMAFSHFIISSGRQCGPPTPPSGSIIIHPLNAHKLNHNNGNVVAFGCKQGLYLVGSPIIKCSGNTWTSTNFKCKGICPEILHIQNGVVIPATPRLGYSAVEFRCSRSYLLIGRPRLECINGRWNGRLPFCEVVVCPYPAIPENAYIVHPVGDRLNYTHGTTMFLACRERHYLTGSPMLICNGTSWSKIAFTCTASCTNLGPVDNAVITPVTMKGGSEVQIYCRTNYTLVGESHLKCVDGRWNASLPSCKAPCSDPGYPNQGDRIVEGFRHNQSVTFTCPRGYVMQGAEKINCLNSRWSARKPNCKEACKNPGKIDYGSIVGEDFSYGSSITFSCDHGYDLRGPKTLTCSGRVWNDQKPECKKKCVALRNIFNGYAIGVNFTHGGVVRFICKQGRRDETYDLIGDSSITCQDGNWSAPIPFCQECGRPLGWQHRGSKARLHGSSSWCTTFRVYLQINLPKPYKLTLIATQGGEDVNSWVSAYSIRFKAGENFIPYRESEQEMVHKRISIFM